MPSDREKSKERSSVFLGEPIINWLREKKAETGESASFHIRECIREKMEAERAQAHPVQN